VAEEKGPRLLKRKVLGRRDVKSLKAEAGSLLESMNTNAVSQATLEDGSTIYIVSREVILGRKNEILFPTLANPVINDLPSALVDMGAIPYVCNGAHVMAPGIMDIEGEFEKDGLLVIRDIKHRKALGIGLALYSSEEMRGLKKGKAILNLHYVGDKIWASLA
jgi:predicted RNA-binding protein (TIGR00451 family)